MQSVKRYVCTDKDCGHVQYLAVAFADGAVCSRRTRRIKGYWNCWHVCGARIVPKKVTLQDLQGTDRRLSRG